MRLISTALAVGFALAAAQAEAKDPLRDRLKSDQDGFCYRRDYDAAHRERHPGQATQTVLLSFRKDATRVMLRQRDREYYIVAACDWSEKAGYDTSGNLMIKAFKGASVPIPKFVSSCSTPCTNFGIERTLANYRF